MKQNPDWIGQMKITKLTQMGNSHGIIIPKNYLKVMDVDINTKFKLMTDGSNLLLKQIKKNQSF